MAGGIGAQKDDFSAPGHMGGMARLVAVTARWDVKLAGPVAEGRRLARPAAVAGPIVDDAHPFGGEGLARFRCLLFRLEALDLTHDRSLDVASARIVPQEALDDLGLVLQGEQDGGIAHRHHAGVDAGLHLAR